jgi:hypothetical protein
VTLTERNGDGRTQDNPGVVDGHRHAGGFEKPILSTELIIMAGRIDSALRNSNSVFAGYRPFLGPGRGLFVGECTHNGSKPEMMFGNQMKLIILEVHATSLGSNIVEEREMAPKYI